MEVNPNLSKKAKRDYEIVKRAKAGEEAAFTSLLDIYRDRIYYTLLKKVKNPIDAEDITIETFGKAFKNLAQYRPIYAFSSWLFKIAHNNCIDFIRKQKHKHVSLDNINMSDDGDEGCFDVASDMLDPEERLIKEQKAELLSAVVKKLKPRYSTLIKYRYYKEMSYKEIADKMEVPLGTVKAQLFRSRELLRAILHTVDS
ncbi:MAG: sigma-70 family RNA polymerase sigma factor [Bacteroidota bacterium]|nr:sigma-70 family RNA polymerase sigma factor [Bacteroidota bacterium]